MSMPAVKPYAARQLFEIRQATEEDINAITEPGGIGTEFYNESEFPNFATLDLECLRRVTLRNIEYGELCVLAGLYKGELTGFVMFSVARHYTVEPLAQLFLFFVSKRRRMGPLGRALLMGAEQVARDAGAVAFYAGATANMGGGIDERLMNLLDKRGYMRLGGVARKLLQESEE